MSKQRSLYHQLNYACTQHCRMGHSRRAEQHNSNYKYNGYIYSVKYADSIRDTIRNFTNYMAENHAEVKQAKDITQEHVLGWINNRHNNWSNKTLNNHLSKMHIIEKQVHDTYKSCRNHFADIKAPERERMENIRTIAMSKEDFQRLDNVMQGRRTPAKDMIRITRYTGLRANECSHLHKNNIDIEHKVIHVIEGAKNGRHRDVPIKDNYIPYFIDLKNRSTDYVLGGIKTDSLNRAVRRTMNTIELTKGTMADKYRLTTDHAIRKLYARERMEEERKNGLTERNAWNVVCAELGHGADRTDLYKVYIGGTL